jgi:predicted nucleotidyltransferase
MHSPPLLSEELALVCSVLRLHPEVHSATLFGSRAKGTHHQRSDVDLALSGELGPLGAEAIAAELEELPLPYRFDVHALEQISFSPLLEHIQRVGLLIGRLDRLGRCGEAMKMAGNQLLHQPPEGFLS